MIRRYFLRILAVSPFAGLAAMQSARGETGARAAGPAGAPGLLPGRADLLLRMGRIHALRKMVDAGDAELAAIADEYKGVRHGDPRDKEWFDRSDPIFRRTSALEARIEELEREPLDTLMGDPEIRPGGALWELRTGRFSDGTEWVYSRTAIQELEGTA